MKWIFWSFQVVMIAAALSNCSLVLPYTANPDPEVAMGALWFAALLGAGVFALWPLGTLVLGVLLLLTRGRRLVIEVPSPNA